jgi:hypothetical protein
MFDPSKVPTINTNIAAGLKAIGAKASNINRSQLTEAYYLLKNAVLAWQGDGHNAMNVLQEVATGSSNLDRGHAADAAKAMTASPPTLAIIAG